MKKERNLNLLWGVILVLVGALFLLQNVGWIPELAASVWVILFSGASILFVATYLAQGVRAWGWLFPALSCGAIALIIGLAEAGLDGAYLGTLMLWAVSVPFWVAYLSNRQANQWALIPGWATAVIGGVVLLADIVRGEWIGALIMFGIALPFLIVYVRDRKQWWALIPAYVMGVLGIVILLSMGAAGETIGALFMFAIGLPFLVVYLRNQTYWWALIPAFVMGVLGVIILLSQGMRGEFVGAFFMFAIAVPFFIVYRRYKAHWWALIPTGILSSIGLIILLTSLISTEGIAGQRLGGLLLLGFAAPFAWLWLRRHQLPTTWARYPAVALTVAALIVGIFGTQMEIIWAIVLIGIGGWMLLDNVRQPRLKG